MAERVRELSDVSFIKALIPIMRAPSLLPNLLPKAQPPNTSSLEIKFQHMNFGSGGGRVDTNI